MPIASSIFWVAGFFLSVIMGPTLRVWTWGPTMLCFAAATAFAIPHIWRDGLGKLNLCILISGLATAAWFAGRAWFSPARELALIDLTLVAMAVSTFIVFQNAFRDHRAQAVIIGGIAALLCLNLAVMAVQYRDISYNLFIPHVPRGWPAGLFRHYSHCATFLIMGSLLLGAFSIKSSWPLFIRIMLLIIAVLGLAAVYITKSRSGMMGACGGFFTLLFYWLLTGKRDDRKWCGIALLLAPIALIIIVAISISTLQAVQQNRHEGSDLIDMMDNNFRLYLYGIALSCIILHPFVGGGSRSFSWENYRFWNSEDIGAFAADPEHVHNEFVQVFTDYGIIGAGVLTVFICGIVILCTFRSFVSGEWSKHAQADAWRIGGIAGFIGIFIQSNFEGVLRTAPGAIILAICLAAANHDRFHEFSKTSVKYLWSRRISLTAVCLIAACLMGFYGWKGSMVSKDLWTTVFEKSPVPKERKIENYSKALAHWELESLFRERGILRHDLAFEANRLRPSRQLLELAIQDYHSASALHPYSPIYPRNMATVHSSLDDSEKASEYFEKAIRLQGGMEAGFKSRLLYAEHLFMAGTTIFYTRSSATALEYYKRSTEVLESIPPHLHGTPQYTLQKNLIVNTGKALEEQKQFQSALEKFDLATRAHHDTDASYFAGSMLSSAGERALSQQRSTDALRLFKEAEIRFHQSVHSTLISQEERNQILTELRKKIVSLEQAGHQPSAEIRFE